MSSRILAVDDSPLILKLIAGVLSPAGYEVHTASSGTEALAQVGEIQPELIILDVTMPGMNGYELCRTLRQMPVAANLPIIMLTSLDSLENKIKGFEAGADDYMLKPFQAAELRARVEALLLRSSAPASLGIAPTATILAVFSLRGGSGVSSLAANLAAALAQLWEVPVVLVDLALTAGQAALMLNLSLRHTWANLATVGLEEMDSELLDNVLLHHASGVRVLAAPSRPEESELISAEKVTYTLAQLGQHYHYLVLDLPHDFKDTSLAGLDAAHQVLAVMTPDLASVRAMASTLDVFDMLDYPAEKVRVVLNNTFQRHGLSRRDIESALKRPMDLEIPFAPDAFVPAVNRGRPPVLDSPASEAAVTLEDYAFQLSKKEHTGQPPESPSAAWKRVNRRIKRK
jgi:pilus assembly protein CpaE